MSSNQLEGAIPDELGGISSLIYLNLGNNLLSGDIPASLGNSNATHMYLQENDLGGDLSFGNNSSLIELNVSGNQDFNAVFQADISGNVNFTLVDPCHISDYTALTQLGFFFHHFSF